jgi:signal transduction histidine kinase
MVSFFHDADWTHVLFSDNGKGVHITELPFLKEKFYQVDKSRSHRGEKGIGVGLSIVDKIVELHGGILSFDSDTGK